MFDFGLSKLLMPVLEWLYAVTTSYPAAIILITLLVKLVLIPLDIKQKKSISKMSGIKPQMDALQAKYKNDKEKLAQKQMELYKKEKISPFSGCLPAIVMIIPLFALLAVLNNAAGTELRRMYDLIVANDVLGLQSFMDGAKFLWIQNIWQADTFFGAAAAPIQTAYTSVQRYAQFADVTKEAFEAVMVNYQGLTAEMQTLLQHYVGPGSVTNGLFILPLLAGLTQFLYTKLTPTAASPSTGENDPSGSFQKVMMYGFPLMSVWICATTNAGFSLYWTFSNIFMMATQFILNRTLLVKGDSKT